MTVNQKILDMVTGRAVRLQRFTATQKREILAGLRKLFGDLVRELRDLSPIDVMAPSLQQNRLLKLSAIVADLIDQGVKDLRRTHDQALAEIAELEALWFQKAANKAVGVDIMTVSLSRQQVRRIVSDTLIEGAPSKEWWEKVADSTRQTFINTVRAGMAKGLPTEEIVQQLIGTKTLPGALVSTERQVEALVRTSVQTVANQARLDLYDENQDVLKGIQWVATLDNRTTIICMGLHGKVWSLPDYEPVDHDIPFPGPTAHWNCRSTQVAVFRSWRELAQSRAVPTEAGGRSDIETLYERNLIEQGFSREEAARILRNARASMDGEVPRALTFDEWLSTKSKAFQDEMLGPGRAELWRSGKLTLTELLDQNGRPLPLEVLKRKYGSPDD
jgi:SPP1 gp7 family putative phage head morphogenesis protein